MQYVYTCCLHTKLSAMFYICEQERGREDYVVSTLGTRPCQMLKFPQCSGSLLLLTWSSDHQMTAIPPTPRVKAS
jgi:hypothetical protein